MHFPSAGTLPRLSKGTPVNEPEATPGIEPGAVTAWLAAHVGLVPPLRFFRIPGGRSNLTYTVTDAAGRRVVVRRPPLGNVLATAHDVAREFRIISALGPTHVPVAPSLALCRDPDVTGAPFYVMDYVDGAVLHDLATVETAFGVAERGVLATDLVDVLARLHTVDSDEVGLGDLGRKEGYVARQLKRWAAQWEQSRTRDLPEIDRVHDRLARHIPAQGPAAVVHGDFRLGNCISARLDGAPRIAAVLDWELCTLGDPLADVGYMLGFWVQPDDTEPVREDEPSQAHGFPPRDTLLARYAEQSGRDVSEIDFYIAFAWWKVAVIVEGVYARYRAGVMGQDEAFDVAKYGEGVVTLARAADRASARLS